MTAELSRVVIVCPDGLDMRAIARGLTAESIRVDFVPFGHEMVGATDIVDAAALVVIATSGRESDALNQVRELQQSLGVQGPSIAIAAGDFETRRAGMDVGADVSCVWPIAVEELAATVDAMVRGKKQRDQLIDRANELERINRRLKHTYQQIEEELDLAAKIQQSFLPRVAPTFPRARFAVKLATPGVVSGDCYDVFPLGDETVGFYVADAMGHGIPACLLTIYIKMAVAPTRAANAIPLAPDRVLDMLNRELIAQQLSENPFVTMVYAALNTRSGAVAFARAGHPYPLLIPREGPIEQLNAEGSLLGVFQCNYGLTSRTLDPGDKLLVYTDGVEMVQYGEYCQGIESFVAGVEKHRGLAIDALIERVYEELFPDQRHDDDLTLLGVEVL